MPSVHLTQKINQTNFSSLKPRYSASMFAAASVESANRAARKIRRSFKQNDSLDNMLSDSGRDESNDKIRDEDNDRPCTSIERWHVLAAKLMEKYSGPEAIFSNLPIAIHKAFIDAQSHSGISLPLVETQFVT